MVSLGWLSFTVVGHWSQPHEALNWAKRLYSGAWVPVSKWRGYSMAYQSEFGVRAGFRWNADDDLETHFEFSASSLEQLAERQQKSLLTFACKVAKNITRIDAALDDFGKIKTPAQVRRIVKKQETVVTRVDLDGQGSTNLHSSDGQRGGDTFYLGSPKSECRLRVYDKAAESGGAIDSIRWELQLRGERARGFALTLIAVHGWEKLGQTFAEYLVRHVDFRNRAEESNVTRAKRLPWFKRLVGSAERAKRLALEAPKVNTLESMREYFMRSCAGMLSTLVEASIQEGKHAWLGEVLDYGQHRRTPKQQIALMQHIRSVLAGQSGDDAPGQGDN